MVAVVSMVFQLASQLDDGTFQGDGRGERQQQAQQEEVHDVHHRSIRRRTFDSSSRRSKMCINMIEVQDEKLQTPRNQYE